MDNNVNMKILHIREDVEELNKFIEEYRPFIIVAAEKALNRYVDCKNDEEWSIALLAFNEAIKSYEPHKGSFLSFAQMVIKMRLIDHFRKEVKHKKVIYINKEINEEDEIDLSEKQAMEEYKERNISDLRRMEIIQLTKELQQWDVTFKDLVKASPKRKSTRKIYNTIINFLLTDKEALDYMLKRKYIPIAEIEKGTLIPRKKIERARKYIISVIVIKLGDYEYLKEYINLEEEQ
jgi:RNA polymerase sigma factor